MDKATSPFANDVRILEVAPPGAEAIIITPTANSGDIGHNLTRIKVNNNNVEWVENKAQLDNQKLTAWYDSEANQLLLNIIWTKDISVQIY